jgi:hypothetical protein
MLAAIRQKTLSKINPDYRGALQSFVIAMLFICPGNFFVDAI